MNNRIARWNPLREMAAMQTAFDRILDDAWRTSSFSTGLNVMPFDVHETDTAYTVITSLPGLTTDDIHITLQDGSLTISGELHSPEVPDGGRMLMNERLSGKFQRRLSLPQEVDADKVEAQYVNGVLTLTLPKAPEVQPRQIPVRANSNLLQNQN